MKIYHIYTRIQASDEVSSSIIVYHCLSNIWAVFEPQIRKVLIINNFYILHRQVKLPTNDKR